MALRVIYIKDNGVWVTKIIGAVPTENNFTDALKLKLETMTGGELTTEQLNYIASQVDISTKQDTLVSGTNIKTINSTTLLGAGDIAIEAGVSLATVKADTDIASAISQKHASGSDNQDLSGLVVKVTGSSLVTDTEITKLAGVEVSANNYSHPANHAASVITQDVSNRFVTDTEKGTWNGKEPGNANIQTHVTAAHAPSTAQANADGGTLTGILVARDHGAASTDEVVNCCYGTSSTPPTANTTTEGTIYIQYTA